MLLRETIVKKSPIAGLGLFAAEDISRGQIIWKYDPLTSFVLKQDQLNVLKNSFQHQDSLLHYLTYGYHVKIFNGLLVCLDNGKFVNHSLTPNSGLMSKSDESNWQYSVAIRDIEKGEEITENYNTYDHCDWLDDLCRAHGIFVPEREEACLSASCAMT